MPHRGQKGPEWKPHFNLTCAENVLFAKQFLPLPIQDRMNRSCPETEGKPRKHWPHGAGSCCSIKMPHLSLLRVVSKSRAECREQALSHCSGEATLGASSHCCFPRTKIDALVSHRCSAVTPAPQQVTTVTPECHARGHTYMPPANTERGMEEERKEERRTKKGKRKIIGTI